MKLNPKMAVCICILAIILVASYLFSVFHPSTPANTTRYENTEAGLSFYYPQSLTKATSIDRELIRLALPITETGGSDVSDTITFGKPITLTQPADLQKVLVEQVTLDPSGEHPDSLQSFGQIQVKGQRFYFIQSGRFEGWLSYDYFLVQDKNVLPIFARWYIGDRWTDPTFEIKYDARYTQLITILSTIKLVQK